MATKKEKQQFYLGNEKLPTPDALFDYESNPEWIKDIDKCKKNILYFAENFFYITNLDEGKIKIKLHLFQKRILRSLRDNRFVVMLSSRQSGKALALDTPILTTSGWSTMGELKKGDQVYGADGVPCNIVHAHETLNNRKCYKVVFDNGEEITADANHLWYTESRNERTTGGTVKTTQQIVDTIYAPYCKEPNHRIPACVKGVAEIEKEPPIVQSHLRAQWHYIKQIIEVPSVPVRCITVDSVDNLYLAGKQLIPTHNTTLFTIYALWIVCFQTDQRILIVANKEATAINIFKRVRMAYEMLPNYLKSGIVEYGKTSMTLANGSSIGISTTSSDAGRGDSVNCITGDSIVTIRNSETGEIQQLPISELTKMMDGELSVNLIKDE
jgi:hypothetical protein